MLLNKKNALQASAAQRWDQAAIALRHVLATSDGDGEMRLELGKCYFRAGRFAAAAKAFESAMMDELVRGAALVNLGHLACAQQDFVGALKYFEAAAKLATPNSQSAARIDALIARVAPVRDAMLVGSLPADRTQLVFSGPDMDVKQGVNPPRSNLGEADYSYAFAARGFLEALHATGTAPEFVINPEYVADCRRTFGAKHCVHLRFSPPTNPRLIKGATNILIFAWEFGELPLAAGWPHPFADRCAMISRFDEVWLPSRHSAAVVASLTTANVRFVPSPVLPRQNGKRWEDGRFLRSEMTKEPLPDVKFVPLAIFPQFQRFLTAHAKGEAQTLGNIFRRIDGRPKIFLTIANPHDQRKNLRPLIEAFADYARQHADAILLIKTSAFDFRTDTINDLILSHQLARDEESLAAFVSKSIWICNESLNDDDLDELYAVADFYICSPIAEGQNLPLLEAMLRGCLPVAPRHTAMLDYISTENAVIIPSRSGPPPESFRAAYGLRNAEVDLIEADDVQSALQEAGSLNNDQMATIAGSAQQTVRCHYNTAIMTFQLDRLRGMPVNSFIMKVNGR